jgi:hypothetical protein
LSAKGQQGPDHVSFGNMLQCADLIPDGQQKTALIQSTFKLCCRDGFVNSFVIRYFQSVASEDLWRSILGCPPESDVNTDLLPATWTRMSSTKQRKKDLDQVRKSRQ